MSNLEYHLPPLTEEERERGRRRMLHGPRVRGTRYYRNADTLRRELAGELILAGMTDVELARKSGQPLASIRFLLEHGYAPVGTVMKVFAALGITPANLPAECVGCRMEA